MCFAIAPEQRSSRGRLACAWWRVAHSPFRLLLLGTLMQGLLLVVVAASSAAESTPPVIPAIQFILVYGIAGSLIFGTLLNWLPEWFNRSPVEYGWYAITNVLMIAGAAFVVTGLYRGGALGACRSSLLLAGMAGGAARTVVGHCVVAWCSRKDRQVTTGQPVAGCSLDNSYCMRIYSCK